MAKRVGSPRLGAEAARPRSSDPTAPDRAPADPTERELAASPGDATEREQAARALQRVLPALVRALAQAYWSKADSDPVHVAQVRVLARLQAADFRLGDLARELGLSPSTLTVTVDSLVRRGLVERRREAADRRVVCLRISPAGRTAFERVSALARGRLQRLLNHLTPAEAAALTTGLEALERALATAPADPAALDDCRPEL